MTSREIFDAYFSNGNRETPRIPLIEYAPYWDLTMNRWYEEGLDKNLEGDRVQKHFGLDPLWYTSVTPVGNGFPYPADGMPAIYTEEDYEKILPTIYPQNPLEHTLPFILERQAESQKGEFMFELNLYGFFWWPRILFGIENHLVSFYEVPELYHRICRDLLEYNVRAVKSFLEYASPPFVLLAEDMSYNHGPMIGKNTWDEFLKPYYLEFTKEMKKLGLNVIYDSDGKIDGIIPWLIESGFDGLLPLERMAGVDINNLTTLYPDFKFIGGFDKTVMKNGREAMRQEFERLLPAIKRGSYIPCVDHQTPPDVSTENYLIYMELFREYAIKAVK